MDCAKTLAEFEKKTWICFLTLTSTHCSTCEFCSLTAATFQIVKKKTKCKAVCNENHVLSISSRQRTPLPSISHLCPSGPQLLVASHFPLPSEAVCFCFQAWALSQETVYTLGAFRKGRAAFPFAPSLVTCKGKKGVKEVKSSTTGRETEVSWFPPLLPSPYRLNTTKTSTLLTSIHTKDPVL